MDDRGANIDLVFRNGLKDYEVLPPAEVWDNVSPAISKKPPFVILRAAALIAVLVTLSGTAYLLNRSLTSDLRNPVAAFNIRKIDAIKLPAISYSSPELVGNKDLNDVSIAVIENNSDNSVISESAPAFSTEESESSDKSELSRSQTAYGLQQTVVPEISFNVKTSDPEFNPDLKPAVTERWSITAMASPTYYSSFAAGNDNMAKKLKDADQALLSYAGGVSVSYKINKKLSIQTGVYYASMGQQVTGINTYSGFQNFFNTKGGHGFEVLTSSGSVFTDNADVYLSSEGAVPRVITAYNNDVFDPAKANLSYISSSLIQSFSYLQVPVFLRYKLIDKSLDFNLIGGVSYDILVSNDVYARGISGKYAVGETQGLNPLTFTSSLGMGMEYSFSRKLSLNLEPTFRYYLNPFNENGPRIHPYSFGIFSGLSYKF